jgi:hypothetical protein
MTNGLSRMKTMNHCATVGRAVPCAPRMDGRARSPLRAADAVKFALRRGAHGVTRPTGKGRFMERLDGKGVVTHEDDEPLRKGRARSPLRAADGR